MVSQNPHITYSCPAHFLRLQLQDQHEIKSLHPAMY